MRSIRLPLEVGISTVNSWTIAALCLPIGFATVVAGLIGLVMAPSQGVGELMVGGVLVFGFGMRKLAFGWRARPADILIESDGFRIEGGEHDGLALLWTDVRECTVRTVGKDMESSELWLDDDFAIAEADDDTETASLNELAAAINTRSGAKPTTASAPEGTPAVLRCASCGAPVAPSAEENVRCAHCGATTSMAPDVRERVRAALDLPAAEKRVDRLVGHLLDQPGARSTTFLLSLSLALFASAGPLTVWAYVHTYLAHQLTFNFGAVLAVLPFLLVLDGFCLSRLRMVDRRALASLVTAFGARPPAQEGGPAQCRSCWAPLRDANATVVRCVFCDASNITGVDLRALAGRTSESQDSLEAAMLARNLKRWQWRGATIGALAVAVATFVLLKRVYTQRDVIPIAEDLHIAGSSPKPSHDGATIVFMTKDGAWKVLDIASRAVTDVPSSKDAWAVAPLSSGRFVVTPGRSLYVTNAARDKTLIAFLDDAALDMVVSPDETEVALKLRSGAIVRVPLAPTTPTQLPPSVGKGKEVVFAGKRLLFEDDFYALTHHHDEGVVVSPKGTRLAFSSGSYDGKDFHHDIKTVAITGGDHTPLTYECADCIAPAWNGDGYIYYVSGGTLHRLNAGQ